uniref:Reverse transcriptase domain-containing protein n=1 Tax=Nicotiana tabacum TaxID=4097 RepID=A0A1S3XPY5_TOBAC|nr:PREDICTED: uncharacterized protein LOC107767487 [Nicotiana tabacum]
MELVAEQEGFAYHKKYKGLKLNHLCFADDVLIFYKGDFQAIVLMRKGLQTFSNASGLTTNAAKSNVFSANMDEQCLNDLCELTGYKRGAPPLRYLGFSISPRKLSAMDCETLVDKLTMKVKCWGSRNLSYACRVLLVNIVLLYIYSYWSTIIVFPKKVINSIIAVCRNVLWYGKAYTNKSLLVACDLVFRTKKQGGLWIHDIVVWNEATVAKILRSRQKDDKASQRENVQGICASNITSCGVLHLESKKCSTLGLEGPKTWEPIQADKAGLQAQSL